MALSVLDQSPVLSGSTPVAALRQTVALAERAEQLGYHRYWLAEHHNTASLAGSAPEILVAHVASRTSVMRVGAGGILLSHYPALKVAETFQVLNALFPGRIDLGLGRADAGGAHVVSALQCRPEALSEAGYRDRVVDLMSFLGDATGEDHRSGGVRAMPAGEGRPEVWVLSTSSFGARLAGHLGLPLSFAHFVSPRYVAQILAAYRAEFRPSVWCPEPAATIAVSVLCSDSDDDAERLAVSDDRWHLRPEGGDRGPLLPADEAAAIATTALDRELLEEHRRRRFVGGVEKVHRDLRDLVETCQVAELIVRTVCHDPAARVHSYELLAEAFGVVGR